MICGERRMVVLPGTERAEGGLTHAADRRTAGGKAAGTPVHRGDGAPEGKDGRGRVEYPGPGEGRARLHGGFRMAQSRRVLRRPRGDSRLFRAQVDPRA